MGLRALVKARDGDLSLSFGKWLLDHRQSSTAVDRFWAPVLVSALSETLDRVDVASARKVFVDGFLANRDAWRVQIPTRPLGALYGTHLMEWLSHRGAIVRMPVGADRVVVENGLATGVALRGGEVVEADQVIVAVPHWLVLDLLPRECRDSPALADLNKLETAPISSVHLWFDRPILFPASRERPHAELPIQDPVALELPHVVLIDRLSQWVFNRTLLLSASEASASSLSSKERTPPENGYSYQVVISASREIASLSQQDVIARVVDELADVFPLIDGANLLHSRMVTEHRAVFSVVPGSERFRPPQQSPIVNLQLAGDWTRTDWPSTMEGAVRSGYLAAENVLTHLGRPASLLQPDLPVAPLSRLLLGIGRRQQPISQ
jgi:squalene-associated FAD-dependent desaturase